MPTALGLFPWKKGGLGALALAVPFLLPSGAWAALDFELPGGRDNGFVRLSTLPPRTTVVNFWRADCPPCLREMAALQRFATEHPDVRVVTVALQKPFETASSPVLPAPPILSLHGPSQPQGLLGRFGNPSSALPFTVVLTAERESCIRQHGEIDERWLERQRLACAR